VRSRALALAGLGIGVPLALALATSTAAVAAGGRGAPVSAAKQKLDILQSVAATSRGNAWAVGYHWNFTRNVYQPLIEHWNGSTWRLTASPVIGGKHTQVFLRGVCALSASSAWAVGYATTGNAPTQTVIEHWNGAAWKRVPSPSVKGVSSFLVSVAATSKTSAWAVGNYGATAEKTLIEHWNGRAWRRVPSPNVSGASTASFLNSVTATSPSATWAVGYSGVPGPADQTLAERWAGGKWAIVASPSVGSTSTFQGASATSATNVWAVGVGMSGPTEVTLTERWNGSAWQVFASPNPSSASASFLASVAAVSPKRALAVGDFFTGGVGQNLAESWNGAMWTITPTPDIGGSAVINNLNGVAATSATSAWAVGVHHSGSLILTLIERWNGHAWKRVPSPSP
jgi:hypothetical protein